MFICGGAFDGLEKIIENRIGKKSIGFGAELAEKSEKNIGELLKQVTPTDFVKYGLIPEFIGRVPVAVTLDLLDDAALVRILTEPKSAVCKQYKKLFELDGVELEFTDEALTAIAREATERKTGARGLRSIIEKVVMDLMYEVPSDEEIIRCTITKEAVDGTGKPDIVRSDKPRQKKPFTKHHSKNHNGEIA